MKTDDRIYVAGHDGMVGSAVVRAFEKRGFHNLVYRTIAEMDLTDYKATGDFIRAQKPDVVVLAAARVGGIKANMEHPAEFLRENLAIQNNVIHHSYLNGVKRFCFLGSSCIYPRECPQPMKEEYLMTGPLEPTNEGYAIAKIAGLKMIEYYGRQYGFSGFSVMPCNLYGTNDHFDLNNSHVLSSLVRRFVDAVDNGEKKVTAWGTGIARREFMHVDDAAEAILFLLERYESSKLINLGWGRDVTVKELAALIAEKTGFSGEIAWDSTKPDGMMRKCMDVSRMRELGFSPAISLDKGVEQTIKEYKELKRKSTGRKQP